MKLNTSQTQHICEKILRDLKDKNIIIFKAEEGAVLKRMIQELEKNLKEEETIELEAKKLLEVHKTELSSAGMNQAKFFGMLKKEIAKKKGFIL
ncbi:MAG: DUF507 family protein [bacterium]